MYIVRRSGITRSGLTLEPSLIGPASMRACRRSPLDVTNSEGGAPSRTRSGMLRGLIVLIVVAVLGLAHAAQIVVTTADDELDFFPNGTCSLREAINSINDATPVGGCIVSGAFGQNDTIILPERRHKVTRSADGRLCLYFDQDCGDLNVRRNVVIAGVSARRSIIESSLEGASGELFAISVEAGVTAVFRDLTVTATSQAGSAGIANDGDLTLERVIVRGNRPLLLPGGGIRNSGDLTVRASLVVGNTSTGYGGGIAHGGTSLFVENSTISGNDARYRGGGIHVMPALGTATTRTDLWSVTIAGNRSGVGSDLGSGFGAGLHLDNAWYGEYNVRVENSLIAGNTNASSGLATDCFGTFESLGFNLIGAATECVGFDEIGDQTGTPSSPIDPLLAPLANNGGPTDTRALLPGSPAIDAGPLQILDSCLATDQRGLPRANDGNGNGFLNCDIGAFEAPAATVPAQANLSVQLFDLPDPVAASAQLQYNVLVTNHGPDPAVGVEITFVEPAGANVFDTNPVDCVLRSTSPDTFVCAMGTLIAGASTGVSVDLTAPGTATTLIATAMVDSATDDPFLGDNVAQEETVVAAPAGADLAMQVRAMGYEYVLITEPILYDLEVTNAGPSSAGSVVVTAPIPAGAAFVTASPGCTAAGSPLLLTCSAGLVASGATRTFELFLGAPVQPGLVTLTASVTTSTTDPDVSNNVDSFTTTVRDVPNADLFIAVTGPAQVDASSEFVLNLIPFNNGPETSPGVFVWLTLAPDADVVAAPAFCTDLGSLLRCFLGEVAAFGTVPSYPVTVRAPATTGTATFTATIEGASIDPLGSNDTASHDVTVVAAAVDPPPPPPPDPVAPPTIDPPPPSDPIAPPSIDLTEGPSAPTDGTIAAGETGVPALQIQAQNSGTVAAQVTSVTLRASGTGDDRTGIAGVGLFLDFDGDGQVGAGDGLLATGSFAEDDGDLVLPIATALQAGAHQQWLVVVDFSNTAAARPLPLLALGGLILGLGTVGMGRRRWPRTAVTPLALGLGLALGLTITACRTAPPPPTATDDTPPRTYAITIIDVQASDLAGDTSAVITGLPITGATLTIQE
jgi:CSLREA domain-containing protein/uncharacterized repeat protein (TIGR01451 family)